MRSQLIFVRTLVAGALALSWAPALARPAAEAGAAPAGLRLSLRDAVERTLGRHPALAASVEAHAGAEARVDQAESTWLPRATVEAGYRYSGPVPELVVDTGITPPGQAEPVVIRREAGTAHSAQAGVRVGWRAWDWGARDATIEAAQQASAATTAERNERAAEIAWGVRGAYLSVQLFEQVATVTEGSLETARDGLAQAETLRDAGLATDLDVARAQSRVAQLEARLVSAHQSRERAARTLCSLLGLPEDTDLVLTEVLTDPAEPQPAPREDEATHPRVARLAALERATEQRRAAVERSFWPTVDVFGSTHYQYPHTFFETDKAGFVWEAGVGLTWEVFDGGQRDAREDELDAKAAELTSLQDAAREDIDRASIDARTRLESARAAVAAARRDQEAAELYFEAAQTSYDAGTATALDVRRAEEAVDRARLSVVKARFDGAMAHAALLRARGIALAGDAGDTDRRVR